jgi:hypothetical protein
MCESVDSIGIHSNIASAIEIMSRTRLLFAYRECVCYSATAACSLLPPRVIETCF